MTALGSLSNSINSFISNKYGLGEPEEYTYKDLDGNEFPNKKVVKQYRVDKNHSKKESGDTMSNHDIFLITLSFEPRKNDMLILGDKIYYVDYFNKVGINNYRLFTAEDSFTIPSKNNRQEI